MIYTCNKCLKTFDQKCHYTVHINRKFPCISKISIIEDVNILITEIPDTFIQKQYRQKFQELREAIEGRKITHDDLSFQPRYNPESAKKRLLIVYIEMSLDLAPILYQ